MKPVHVSSYLIAFTFVALMSTLAGCSSGGGPASAATNSSSQFDTSTPTPRPAATPYPWAAATPSPTPANEQGDPGICDPFSSGADQDQVSTRVGLIARLSYVPDGSKDSVKVVEDVFRLGTQLNANIFLNQVNVPTRNFTEGFGSAGREPLKDGNGNKLTAWFGMQMETVLKLPTNMQPGYYQMLLISDDGAVLRLKENGVYTNIVDNNGTHATASACATRALYFDANTSYEMKLDYHQGPPDRIALMMMWKKVSSATADASIALCHTENDTGFYAQTATSPFNQLLMTGFEIVPSAAFELPPNAPSRRCR
jgi:hypothetical protein